MHLRDLVDDDYAIFFALLRDEPSARMAAFGTRDACVDDLAARWKKNLARGDTSHKAIVEGGAVVGFIATFFLGRDLQVTYGIARSHWGRGLASAALEAFLPSIPQRPLHASAAADNVASLRVLQKCGFTIRGTERAFASARGEEIDEVLLVLNEA